MNSSDQVDTPPGAFTLHAKFSYLDTRGALNRTAVVHAAHPSFLIDVTITGGVGRSLGEDSTRIAKLPLVRWGDFK